MTVFNFFPSSLLPLYINLMHFYLLCIYHFTLCFPWYCSVSLFWWSHNTPIVFLTVDRHTKAFLSDYLSLSPTLVVFSSLSWGNEVEVCTLSFHLALILSTWWLSCPWASSVAYVDPFSWLVASSPLSVPLAEEGTLGAVCSAVSGILEPFRGLVKTLSVTWPVQFTVGSEAPRSLIVATGIIIYLFSYT